MPGWQGIQKADYMWLIKLYYYLFKLILRINDATKGFLVIASVYLGIYLGVNTSSIILSFLFVFVILIVWLLLVELFNYASKLVWYETKSKIDSDEYNFRQEAMQYGLFDDRLTIEEIKSYMADEWLIHRRIYTLIKKFQTDTNYIRDQIKTIPNVTIQESPSKIPYRKIYTFGNKAKTHIQTFWYVCEPYSEELINDKEFFELVRDDYIKSESIRKDVIMEHTNQYDLYVLSFLPSHTAKHYCKKIVSLDDRIDWILHNYGTDIVLKDYKYAGIKLKPAYEFLTITYVDDETKLNNVIQQLKSNNYKNQDERSLDEYEDWRYINAR